MQVLFLGTGTSHGVPMIGCECGVCTSGDPRNNRTRASILIRAGGRALLVDAPPDLRQQFLRHKVSHVDAVLMTHCHADHLFGLDDLRVVTAVQEKALPIYADPGTARVIRKNFDYVFQDADFSLGWGIPRFDLREMGAEADVGGVRVIAVPIFHGRASILGYRVGRFAYITDCSAVPETSLSLLKGLDTLVVGAIRHEPHPTHFSVAQAVELIESLAPRRAYLTHISHRLDHAATEGALPEYVRLAYDGLVLDVD